MNKDSGNQWANRTGEAQNEVEMFRNERHRAVWFLS